MKHYIIVKFNEKVNVNEIIDPINRLFNKTLEIEGINSVEISKSNTNLSNRYDLMIKMELSKSALQKFDNSEIHKTWKDEYGDLIISKTIFDCE